MAESKNRSTEDTPIRDAMDAQIMVEESYREGGMFTGGTFSMSDGFKCQRFRYLKFFNYPKNPFPVRLLFLFKVGRMIESIIDEFMKVTGMLYRTQLYVRSCVDERIRGKLDYILKIAGKKFVTELKSVNSRKFWKRRDANDINEKIDKNNAAQVLHYVMTLRKQEEFKDIENAGIILEVSRDDAAIAETVVELTPKWEKDITDDWKEVIRAVDTKTPPPTIEGFPSCWTCNTCAFKPACKELLAQQTIEEEEAFLQGERSGKALPAPDVEPKVQPKKANRSRGTAGGNKGKSKKGTR